MYEKALHAVLKGCRVSPTYRALPLRYVRRVAEWLDLQKRQDKRPDEFQARSPPLLLMLLLTES